MRYAIVPKRAYSDSIVNTRFFHLSFLLEDKQKSESIVFTFFCITQFSILFYVWIMACISPLYFFGRIIYCSKKLIKCRDKHIMLNISILPIMTALPIAPPIAYVPISPGNILAGYQLNIK